MFDILQKAMSKYQELSCMALLRSSDHFATLNEVIEDFKSGLRFYSFVLSSHMHQEKE